MLVNDNLIVGIFGGKLQEGKACALSYLHEIKK